MNEKGEAIVPNTICPPTPHDKFMEFVHDAYSPYNLFQAAVGAGIWQATENSQYGYGQGWGAYGDRFGATMANVEAGSFFQYFLLPTLLHTDPRYFPKMHGGVVHRGIYAASRVLITRKDNGGSTFNVSEVAGAYMASAISNAYYPDHEREAGRTLVTATLDIVGDAGWNLLKEFGPDIWHKMHHQKPAPPNGGMPSFK